MDDIENRLKEASLRCIDVYNQWKSDKNNLKVQEELQDSIHELRKVSSRLEIEIAISEREEMVRKPIPLPPHRANRQKGSNKQNHEPFDAGADSFSEDDDSGNLIEQPRDEQSQGSRNVGRTKVQVRRSRSRSQRTDSNGGSSSSGEKSSSSED